jgi:hypothetical protein
MASKYQSPPSSMRTTHPIFDTPALIARQPVPPIQSSADRVDVIAAMQQDPWAGWARDGDSHWTLTLVREWWSDRGRLRNWITTKHRRWIDSDRTEEREAASGLTDYLAYLDGDLASHLQSYLYFLDNGAAQPSAPACRRYETSILRAVTN